MFSRRSTDFIADQTLETT